MNTKARLAVVALAAVLGGVGAAARAEPTLQYNHDYVCERGLRIVVGHCRHDSDMPGVAPTAPQDDYCQVYYPDRPRTGGIEAMEVVLRGDLIESLQACGAIGAAATSPGGTAKANPAGAVAAPAPARAAKAPTGPGTQTQKQFCEQILQLRSLAAQGFRSIDLGPTKGEPADLHATSVSLVTSDGGCYIGRKEGERPYYACSWNVYDDSSQRYDDTRIDSLGNMLASCLNARADWSGENRDTLRISSVGAEYELYLVAGFMMLDVKPAQPGRPSAPTNSSAAIPAPARADAGTPARGSAAAAQGGRPPSRPMPIGPAMCPLLRRLEALAREDFRSIDLGPDRAAKDPATEHRTGMPVPGADCTIFHNPREPVTYSCIWPVSKEAEDQFVRMVEAFKKCTGGDPDMSMINEYEMADVTMHLRGVDYRTSVINDFLTLDVFMPRP